MTPKIKHTGIGHVQAAFRNIAKRVPDNARSQMKRSAQRVVDLAKEMVPEDEGLLRDSIRIEKSYGTRGRLEIDVVAGKALATKANGRVIDLNQYALMVHEAYETAIAPNGPGPNTLAKMRTSKEKVGSGFLKRAILKEQDSFDRVLVESTQDVIEGESL